jgi:hypothetical protein
VIVTRWISGDAAMDGVVKRVLDGLARKSSAPSAN